MKNVSLLLVSLVVYTAMTMNGSLGFTAYDCEHPNATFTNIDLTEPQACPDPVDDYEEDEMAYFQVIQLDSLTPTKAHQCQVIMTKKVTRCGFDSLVYGNSYPVYKKMVEITPSQCRMAVNTGTMRFENQEIKVKRNQRVTHTYFSHGRRFASGYCETTNFHSEGTYYKGSYEEVFLEIQVRVIRGQIDETEGLITLSNGLRAHSQDKVMMDSMEGIIVWDIPSTSCEERVVELYYGKGTAKRRRGRSGYLDAVVMVKDAGKAKFAGFVLRRRRNICGAECYATQGEDGLALCMVRPEGGKSLRSAQVLPNTRLDITQLELKTHVMFMHTSLHLHLQDQFAAITGELCKMDRRTLSTRLQAIAGVDNPYSLGDMFGKGVTIRRAGAAAYITRCVPIEVKPIAQQNCSVEIPVLRVSEDQRMDKEDNKVEFVDPLSYVIKKYPEVVPCSVVMPIRWKIGNEWTCATPEPRACKAPAKLNVTFGLQPKMDLFLDAVGQGLFTAEQLRQHRMFLRTQETRSAVAARATNAAVRHTRDSGMLGMSIPEEDIPLLAMDVSYYIFPLAYYAGSAWTYIWGTLVGLGLFKLILGCIIRGALVYKRKGCGWWMLTAVWSTAFMAFAYPIKIVREAVNALIEPIQNLPGEESRYDELQRLNEEKVQRHRQEYSDLATKLEELRRIQDALMAQYDKLIMERQAAAVPPYPMVGGLNAGHPAPPPPPQIGPTGTL